MTSFLFQNRKTNDKKLIVKLITKFIQKKLKLSKYKHLKSSSQNKIFLAPCLAKEVQPGLQKLKIVHDRCESASLSSNRHNSNTGDEILSSIRMIDLQISF